MDRHIEVIGVEHGWSGMKTVSQVFTTGVKEITMEPAFYNNIVEFNGSYYKVGGKRLEVKDLKVENDNFYILTLAAVAKELNRRGMRNANIDNIIVSNLQGYRCSLNAMRQLQTE